ncbi:MAG: hypothetical protein ACW98K_08725 [Candidatus Kariarchaeaceae archaeon]
MSLSQDKEFKKILSDRVHGSTHLLESFLSLILKHQPIQDEIENAGRELEDTFPEMVVLQNGLKEILKGKNPIESSKMLLEGLKHCNSILFQKLKENIPNKQRILTFSNSYTIAEVLKNLRDRVIYVCESHPGGEGKVLHEILQGSVLVRDEKGSEMIQHKKIDALIIGCDALTRDVGFINKVGTKVFVSMTRKSQIPVFILTSQLKVTDKLPEITSDLLEEVPWFENMILIIDE